ncbi:YfhO family protein, partial [Patescibacteria group bacterium]|nr:YfhO family protein [Patescibacteria group bacterium]
MEKCFLDGQLPCRWAPDLGGGFGFPLFNYYSPLVYYFGVIFRLLGLSYINTIKFLFIAGIVLTGISMFLLAKEFWKKLGGLVSAVFYIFVPFHALDIYVRGDLAELYALAIVPLVFWGFYRLLKTEDNNFFIPTSLFLAAFLMSHNIMVMLFLPILFFWILFWVFSLGKIKRKILGKTFLAGLLGTGLASFFIIPAWFEKSLVQLGNLTSGYFDFRAHFVTLNQLFLDRWWGFGISQFGISDTISFQIGWPHWWLVIVSLGLAIWKIKDKKNSKKWLILVMVGLFLILSFMAHSRSIFIWEKFSLLAFAQFPWRFLGPITFVGSFLAGSVIEFLSQKQKKGALFLAIFLIGLTVLLNQRYFKPKEFLYVSDKDFFSEEVFKKQQMASIDDFLPETVATFPDFESDVPKIIDGDAKIGEFLKKSDYFKFDIEVYENQSARVLVPVFDFPNWETYIDENKISSEDNPWGLILVEAPPGRHEISGWLRNTKIRLLGNAISLMSLFFIVF